MDFTLNDKMRVIDAYARKGRISITDGKIIVSFDNGALQVFPDENAFWNHAEKAYYLVDKFVIGNKVYRSTIENEVEERRAQIKALNEELDDYRKRLWVYDNLMNGTPKKSAPKTRTISELQQATFSFVAENVKELKLPSAPSIEFCGKDAFLSPTTKAALSEDGTHLGVNTDAFGEHWNKIELCLVIAHECRHAWQIANEKIGEYSGTDQFSDKKQYNEQDAEIDAWAWSCIMTRKRYGVVPDLVSIFGEDFWTKVRSRIDEIK